MKILITTDLYTTKTNGVVTSVRNLTEELRKKGHEVRILTLSENRTSYCADNVYFIRSVSLEWVYPQVRMPISYRNAYLRELIAWAPDVIHSQCEYFSYQFACYLSKKTGAPIVHTYHTLYEQYVTYVIPSRRIGIPLVGALSRLRLKNASAIIAPTRKVEVVLRNYGIENPIYVVPSGISLEQHRERISSQHRFQLREKLGIPEDHTVLLNLGRLGTEKNLDELLHFLHQALAHNPKLTMLIVGGGPAKEHLQQLAQSLGIAQQVIFTGMVNPKEVHIYYQLGDIFISASTSETQGLTYIEAAANGLPLLCRQDPCLQEVLYPGENGYAYETDAEFLAFLDKLSADPQQCRAAGKRSEEIAAGFDKCHFASSIEAIYRSAMIG